MGKVSLILPVKPGALLVAHSVHEYRTMLDGGAGCESVEVVVARGQDGVAANGKPRAPGSTDGVGAFAIHVAAETSDWPALVRAGLGAASGEHLIVLDVTRHYPPESLIRVLREVGTGDFDLAVAVPIHGGSRLRNWLRSWPGSALISRTMLGTSDVFSGLFALRRAAWDSDAKHGPARGSTVVLDSLLRRQPRTIDVPVVVDDRFRSGRLGFQDIRPLKRILDGRFGNYSRLVQFCIVGASGMVVDLSFYALLQFLLLFLWPVDRGTTIFGSSWQLAVAAGMSIATALVWNFTLNRKLTFNDATKGALFGQFLTYVLSNALAILLSFSLRLFLPSQFGFFARHRLAAAVVGIVAATGISFSMSRWLVFARRPELKRPTLGQSPSVP